MQTRKSVLVLGAGGMLGHKLAHVLSADDRLSVTGVTRRPVDPRFMATSARYIANVDVAKGAPVLRELLERERPDVIVNAIGAVKQRDLASAVDETFYVNGNVPHLLALLNPNPQGRVVHFSTDCVFTGHRGGYLHTDRPDAQDLYGRSKACGELDYGRHLTLRTSIIGFELSTHLSLVSWLLRQPQGAPLRGFTHAIFSGLPTVTLAHTVRDLLVSDDVVAGLYNIASEPIAKYDLLRRLVDALGLHHQVDPDASLVIDRSLDDSAFRERTGTDRPGWDELIGAVRDDYSALPYSEIYQQFRTPSI